jgi:protein FAM32A
MSDHKTKMPSNEYSSLGGAGALKLKGAKVKKHKKKRDKTSVLEKALSTGDREELEKAGHDSEKDEGMDKTREGSQGADEENAALGNHKTEAERRFAEAKRKKVSSSAP